MDPVAKGNSFEDIVFLAMKEELKNDCLGLSSSCCKVFQKKAYFSRDRRSNIVVDISIEVWIPGAKEYSLLWVCECKDYVHPVRVDDVEEFKAKLDQIAGKNIKGVFATRSAMQKGALTYAQSNGIGVVRILQDEQVRWVLRGMVVSANESSSMEVECALTYPEYIGMNRAFFGLINDQSVSEWNTLLCSMVKDSGT